MGSKVGKSKAVVITVDYKSADSALAFLASLQRTKAFSEIEVVIVDNLPQEEYLSSIRQAIGQLPNVELLGSAENRGYFGAAKFALDHYLAQGRGLPDWVIVCNHDVLIEDRDFLSRLFERDPSVTGIIAPRIRALPAGVDQNPFMRRRPGWIRWTSLRLIYSNYGSAAVWHWLARQKKALRSIVARRPGSLFLNGAARRERIYAPHGAFFIFSHKYFESGGYLDGNLFLFGEEISVAEISRSLGLPVDYEPSLCVLHNEHRSTGQGITRFSYECNKKALRYLRSRYLLGSKESMGSCRPDPVP